MSDNNSVFTVNLLILDDTDDYEGMMFYRELPDNTHPEIQRLMMHLSNIQDELDANDITFMIEENALNIDFREYVLKKYPNILEDIEKLKNNDNYVYDVLSFLTDEMFKTGVIE